MAGLATAGLLTLPPAAALAESEEAAAPPLLEVKTTSRFEPTVPGEPGKTVFRITTTAFWRVTILVRAHGKTVFNEEQTGDDTSLVHQEGGQLAPGPTGMHEAVMYWTCKPPGTVYRYEVTAADEYGSEPPSLTKAGTFPGATRRQCEQARRVQQRENVEELRRRRDKIQRERDEELARRRRFEANCHTVGGEPVTIQTEHGPEVVCRGKDGGIVPV